MEAEIKQSKNETLFEIECECVDPVKCLEKYGGEDDLLMLSTSILLKMLDLLLPPMHYKVWVK